MCNLLERIVSGIFTCNNDKTKKYIKDSDNISFELNTRVMYKEVLYQEPLYIGFHI